ncbi:MAG: acyl-CoA thioesterase [Flavobacteriales bacterium]|jgi:acyl-CoA thioester hydrolase|nr:acyl-CoA thioesterase [Flavobacteriales bacterium]MBT5090257.1 acyl-CoA thioesterase [Flavobacteriales bacterium]MBT5750072.1 acyl-CoA thioesterase [Flavobacteriales bacterium]
MYSFETKIRVRYGETDQMSFVYYGVYAQYYEVGRVELFRSLGLSYKEIETMGFALPVVNMNIKYKKPAFYDEELTIRTMIKELPSAKITFNYETLNEKGELLNLGEVILVFINKKTGKPCFVPEAIMNKLKEKLL